MRDLARIVRQSKGRSWKSYGIVDVSLFFFQMGKKMFSYAACSCRFSKHSFLEFFMIQEMLER